MSEGRSSLSIEQVVPPAPCDEILRDGCPVWR